MTERRVLASHPDYDRLNDLSQKIAWAKNPQMIWEGQEVDLPEAESKALVGVLKGKMGRELQGGRFHDLISEMDL